VIDSAQLVVLSGSGPVEIVGTPTLQSPDGSDQVHLIAQVHNAGADMAVVELTYTCTT
jgi:hypothetical protein